MQVDGWEPVETYCQVIFPERLLHLHATISCMEYTHLPSPSLARRALVIFSKCFQSFPLFRNWRRPNVLAGAYSPGQDPLLKQTHPVCIGAQSPAHLLLLPTCVPCPWFMCTSLLHLPGAGCLHLCSPFSPAPAQRHPSLFP